MGTIAQDLTFDPHKIVRVVDARILSLEHRHRAKGHLGSHPTCMAGTLASGNHRAWRMQKYIELFTLLMDKTMVGPGSTTLSTFGNRFTKDDQGTADKLARRAFAVFCEKGCHRSVAWATFESAILRQMGFGVMIKPMCFRAMMCHCANRTGPKCPFCKESNEDVRKITASCVDEFFEVMCAAEQHWPAPTAI